MSTTFKLLANMGVVARRHEDNPDLVTLDAGGVANPEAPYELVKTMRASILVLGPLLARFGRARVSLPGGCAIGSRPVDQHIKGLQAMGAQITVAHGYIEASTPLDANGQPTRLKGASITTDMVTVTGTENFLMAAALAEGETIAGERRARARDHRSGRDAGQAMGAQIKGQGTSRIRIQGVERAARPPPVQARQMIADRIEAGTFLCAVGGHRRRVTPAPAPGRPPGRGHRQAARRRRAASQAGDDGIRVAQPEPPEGGELPHHGVPGFPTDMQAQFMALNCVAEGTSDDPRDHL